MSKEKQTLFALVGALIGFSFAIGYLVAKDRDLRQEVTRQVNSVLKSTNKVVNHYKNVADFISASDNFNENEAKRLMKYEDKWASVSSKNIS